MVLYSLSLCWLMHMNENPLICDKMFAKDVNVDFESAMFCGASTISHVRPGLNMIS